MVNSTIKYLDDKHTCTVILWYSVFTKVFCNVTFFGGNSHDTPYGAYNSPMFDNKTLKIGTYN